MRTITPEYMLRALANQAKSSPFIFFYHKKAAALLLYMYGIPARADEGAHPINGLDRVTRSQGR